MKNKNLLLSITIAATIVLYGDRAVHDVSAHQGFALVDRVHSNQPHPGRVRSVTIGYCFCFTLRPFRTARTNTPGNFRLPIFDFGLTKNRGGDMKNLFRLFAILAGLMLWEAIVDAQEVIFLVRHTEQAGPGATDPPLTEAGKERAKRLADILKDAGINQIFVTKWKRTIQTAEPLSKSLKIHTKVYERDDFDGFVARLRTEHPRDRVLIVGHSRPMTPLLKALGHPETIGIAPLEYDNLFVVIPKDEGAPLLVRMRY